MKERIFFDDARKLNIEIGDIETGAIYISVDQDISIIVAFFLDKLYEYICIKIENWKRVRVIVTRSPRPVEQFSRDAINKLSLLLSIDHDRVTTARYALRRLISRGGGNDFTESAPLTTLNLTSFTVLLWESTF